MLLQMSCPVFYMQREDKFCGDLRLEFETHRFEKSMGDLQHAAFCIQHAVRWRRFEHAKLV